MLDKPNWLKGDAATEWDRIVPWLRKVGKEESMDASALAGYCLAVAKMIRCEKEMENAPLVITGAQGGRIPNPLISIQSRAIAEVQRLAKEFGFTPRARGQTAKAAEADEPPPGLEQDDNV